MVWLVVQKMNIDCKFFFAIQEQLMVTVIYLHAGWLSFAAIYEQCIVMA